MYFSVMLLFSLSYIVLFAAADFVLLFCDCILCFGCPCHTIVVHHETCVSYPMFWEPQMHSAQPKCQSAKPKVWWKVNHPKYPQSVLWKCPTQSTQSVVKVPTKKYPKCCESVNPKYPKCCESANPKYPKCCKSTKPKCSKCHGATEWCRSLGRNFYQTTTKLLPYIFS